ncbi:MAG TPA: tetratricopeptide repeat protein [Pyrinomonadaceae bacterium]|jgi:tetratricopeptide (TPR) repeat protein
MITSFISRVAIAALLVCLCAAAASAQVTQASGKVTLKQADGTEVPVKDAIIDFFRTDIAGKFQTKTDKNGRYVHAGIPIQGTFTIAASAPGATPSFITGIPIGQKTSNDFVLSPGDGSRLTLDQIKANATVSPTAGVPRAASAEDKAKAAEAAKKIAEIEASNKKIEESNVTVKRTFDAGNEAYKAKRYDEAITLYNEGLAVRPDEAGLLVSKSFALIGRGVARFNESIQSKSDATREAGFKDWREAAEVSAKAVTLTKAAPNATDPTAAANQVQNRLAALTARAEAMRFVASRVDKSQADAGIQAYQDLMAAEPDPVKKNKAHADMAKMLFDAGEYDRASAEYQKIIAGDPENAEANLYLGFSLFNTGDKAKFQEAANYIGRFVEKAPDTNPTKGEAKSILEFLKTNENIKPMKIETPRPARRRG